MVLNAKTFTDEQQFQLLNSKIIAAGSFACAYRVAGQPPDAKDMEKAFARAFWAISTEVDKHLSSLPSGDA